MKPMHTQALLLFGAALLLGGDPACAQHERDLPEQVVRQRAQMGTDHGGTVRYQYIDNDSEDCGNLHIDGGSDVRNVQSVVRGLPAHCNGRVGNIQVQDVRDRLDIRTHADVDGMRAGKAANVQLNQTTLSGGRLDRIDLQSETDLRFR